MEEELLTLRHEVFVVAFRKVIEQIERQEASRVRRYQWSGSVMVTKCSEEKEDLDISWAAEVESGAFARQACSEYTYPLGRCAWVWLLGRRCVAMRQPDHL